MNIKSHLSFLKVFAQKLGTSLSGMIMPIIGVIIAWGLATAFFIPAGWTPVAVISNNIVGPIIKYLIPSLIGFLGGKLVYGQRGGFMGALATFGVIGGADLFASGFWPVSSGLGPQFLGAMISGPLFAWIFKKIESIWEGKIKTGFEMLIDNFAFGIFGLFAAIFSLFVTPFFIYGLTWTLGAIVNPLAKHNLLWLTSFFVEPAKVLFLNNAINHGVFTPLGVMQVHELGKSILFYIESNPGPGFGLLLAYVLTDKKQRGSAGSASIIQFFGGIHEVYFPFILMRPILILATMAGGATGVAILQIFGAGAVAPASPGSVVALFAESAHGAKDYAGLAISILAAASVSFVVAVLLMKFTKKKEISKNQAIAKMNATKGKESKYVKINQSSIKNKNIDFVVFACDAGMGSSAMGAGILRKLFKDQNLNIKVKNIAIRELDTINPDLVVVQNILSKRAKEKNKANQFIVENFLEQNQYMKIVEDIKKINNLKVDKKEKIKKEKVDKKDNLLYKMISSKNVKLNSKEKSVKDAIDNSGNILLKNKNVTKEYLKSMHKRNEDVSVYIGNGVAIPHGQSDSSQWINESGISLTTYPNGIDWNGNKVYLVIAIAGKDNNHLDILSQLAIKLNDEKNVKKIAKAKTIKEIKEILNNE